MFDIGLSNLGLSPQQKDSATVPEGPTVFTDNFNRANEDLEASANWTMLEGNAGGVTVESNMARARATATQAAYHAPDPGGADHYVQASWLTSPNPGGPFLCCRMTDANNFVGVRYQGNLSLRWELYRRVTGSFTLLGSHSATFNSGDLIRLECEGTEARVILNDVLILTREINSAGLTNQRVGIISRATAINPWIDNFESGIL